jgi:hypothetical protein
MNSKEQKSRFPGLIPRLYALKSAEAMSVSLYFVVVKTVAATIPQVASGLLF